MSYNSRCGSSGCPKSGIKIHNSVNDYKCDPFYNINNISNVNNRIYHESYLETLDLNIENYTLNDIIKLFDIKTTKLDDNIMKQAKKKVLMMHPDKSNLDSKFFLFFSKAYKTLFGIYEFQNKSTNKKNNETYDSDNRYFNDSNKTILNKFFEKNKFNNSGDFNKWFNEQFDKCNIDDSLKHGYNDWLKSEDNIYNINEPVTKSNMNEIFEKQKKQIQSIIVYNGINDNYSSSIGGSLLSSNQNNFSSDFNSNGLGYCDLKQAYTESIVPVSMSDYYEKPEYRKYNSLASYNQSRDSVDTTPLNESDAFKILHKQTDTLEQESMALAYQYAKQSEQMKQKQKEYWASLMKLTN